MRFLSIFLLTALLFSYGMTHSYAQDAQQETVQEQTVAAEQPTVTGETGETAQSDKAAENTESEPPKAAPVKKQNAFSRASDKQIAEAQRFYNKCKDNETLSTRKDCKCAATSYLETRLELGDEASVAQITADNINTCLKDEKSAIKNPNDLDLGVTETQIKEAQSVNDWCESKKDVKNKIDCECLAAKYLEQRLEVGPLIGRDVILGTLNGECHNLVGQAGVAYSSCMRGSKNPPAGIDQKQYCECYSRAYTQSLEQHAGKLGPSSRNNLLFYARMKCGKPDSYK